MKIQIKGTVRTVSSVTEKTGSSNQKNFFQSVIVTVPGWTDRFGEKKGKDEEWEIQLINDAITKHDLLTKNLQGKKVVVDAFLNSRAYVGNNGEAFALNLNLAKLEVYNG